MKNILGPVPPRSLSPDDRRLTMSRREFLAVSAGLAAGVGLGAGTPAGAAGSGVATLTVREPGRLRALAVTDLHFFHRGRGRDSRTLKDVGRMVATHRLDLIVVCGDMWHNDPHGRGVDYCRWSCERMAEFQTPWALARGNHDQADDSGRAEELLTNSPSSLYRGGRDGNYTIAALNPGETAPFWNLILINDGFPVLGWREPQINWFNAEAARIRAAGPAPAFVFAHIPLPQYQDVVEAGLARGVKMEKVCFEGGSREALAALRDSGRVKAMFCGHDHVNNYYGVMADERLEYLRATGYAGYGGIKVRKGATLITAEPASENFSVETVFAQEGHGFAWESQIQGTPKSQGARAVPAEWPGSSEHGWVQGFKPAGLQG